jgi:hypothetical protein
MSVLMLSIIMLNFIMLYVTLKSVIMLTFFLLSAVMLKVIFNGDSPKYHSDKVLCITCLQSFQKYSSFIWVRTKYYKPKVDLTFLFFGLFKVGLEEIKQSLVF